MEKEIIKLEFSGVDLINNPFSVMTKMMMRANKIGLSGRKIQVIKVH